LIEKFSPQQAIAFLASKWQHVQFLLDDEEMRCLLEELEKVFGKLLIFSSMGVHPFSEQSITKEQFLNVYAAYVAALKEGQKVEDEKFRFYFTSLFSSTEKALQVVEIAKDKTVVKPVLPLIQLQLHRFDFSSKDEKVRPQVFGKETISWGIQASYPQLYQDRVTREVFSCLESARFQNASLFRALKLFLRAHSLPVKFVKEGKKIASPLRLGKQCFSWIHQHQELREKGLEVYRYGN
jgi:hypothetical protein